MPEVGDRYRNVSGTELFQFFPPDAVVTVRDADAEDDPSVGGSLVLEYDSGDEDAVQTYAAAVTEDQLDDWFEQVED